MSSFGWTFLLVLVAVFARGNCEGTAFPVIPNYLLECYKDNGIYHRANRMPSSFESFLDLVRKVERGPSARNMNARELAMTLLHHLKLDGVQSLESHAKHFPSDILPFAPSGTEYFKHRLTLVGLVPKIDRDYMKALNETLTTKQMCNLHFMLSYSIDPYRRDDERCSPLFEEIRKPSPAWFSERLDFGGYHRRHERYIQHGENLNGLSGRIGKAAPHTWAAEGTESNRSKGSSELSRRKKSVPEVGATEKKSQVEQIPVLQNPNVDGKIYLEEKDKFTIGDQELLSAEPYRGHTGMQSLVQKGTFGRYGGRYPKPMHSTTDDSGVYTGVIPGIPLSDCPVVNGVVTTPFGSLTIGTVIAGIAAGLNPEDIPPTKLSVDPAELESPLDRVKNIWGVTLAGTVADIISSSAVLDPDNVQILKGGWNDSSDPKWYLLASNQVNHLPEVALRGSLDGFLLGINAKEWTGKFPGFKLSQMLEIYYERFWGAVGAKHRVQLRSEYAPEDIFRKQVHLMSLVLKKQKTNVLTVLNYGQISRAAVSRVIQHIQGMDDSERSHIGTFFPSKIDNAVHFTAVIDSSWGHETLNKIFQILRTAQVVNTDKNNLTIVCGRDGRVLLSSDNAADFHEFFTKDMLLDNCTRGMDLPLIFDTLDVMFRKIFHEEKTQRKMNTDSQVVVLFPYEALLQENSHISDRSRSFRNTFPGVRLMVASSGRTESFLPLVDNAKDLFSLAPLTSDSDLKQVKAFSEEVKQSHQRISRPSCGSYFDDDSQGTEVQVTRDVGLGDVVYYRLLPQYFYTQHGQITLTVRSRHRAPLTVCHSRDDEKPVGPTPRGPGSNYDPGWSPDFPPEASPYVPGRRTGEETEGPVQCKTITSESYRIEMVDPCQGASNLRDCRPLYISMSPPHQSSVEIICPTCRLPTNVQYEITAAGLTCYNSAVPKSLSTSLLFGVFVLLTSRFTFSH